MTQRQRARYRLARYVIANNVTTITLESKTKEPWKRHWQKRNGNSLNSLYLGVSIVVTGSALRTDLSIFALCIMGFSRFWLTMADKEIKVHRRVIRMILPIIQRAKNDRSVQRALPVYDNGAFRILSKIAARSWIINSPWPLVSLVLRFLFNMNFVLFYGCFSLDFVWKWYEIKL